MCCSKYNNNLKLHIHSAEYLYVSFFDNKIEKIDWKDADLLRHYVSDRGKILPRRVTGTKAIYQRELAVAIKRARHMALLPFVRE